MIEPLQDEQAAQLLSQANLQRMRRQWEDSASSCMQVLYHDPDNWGAHALLGDIYADQDRPDEAIQWYCMALDIRPESASVREKLSRIVNARRQEIVKSIDPTRSYMAREFHGTTTSVNQFSQVWKIPRNRRIAISIVAVIAAVLFIFIPMIIGTRNSKQVNAPFATGSAPTDTTLHLQPVDTNAGQAVAQSSPDLTTPANASVPAASPATNASSGSSVRDPSDQLITSALASDPGIAGMGIQISEAILNPSSKTLTITYVSSGSAQPNAQSRDLRDGLNIAKAALIKPQIGDVDSFTMRCLSANSNSAPALTFVGDVSRASISSIAVDASAMTLDQLLAVYSNVWWAPGAAAS